ncbi:hypothetical protein BX261_7273 [Streptomyces sp. 2321.6]|nr:hypothetical protein BX261_7273 [Streptomyces sp. 2321.6]
MSPQEQAAKEAAEAAQRAEATRRQAEADLRRHGQTGGIR